MLLNFLEMELHFGEFVGGRSCLLVGLSGMLVNLLGEGLAFRRELKVNFRPGDHFLGDQHFRRGERYGWCFTTRFQKNLDESNDCAYDLIGKKTNNTVHSICEVLITASAWV